MSGGPGRGAVRGMARGTARGAGPIAVVAAIVATFAITAGPIRASGANPLSAYNRYLIEPLRSSYSIQEVLLTSTPLLFTGLAVAVAFRAGYFNIGAEGQFLAGAMGATVPGLYLDGLPAGVALPVGVVAGAIGGTLWATLPAWLRRVAGIDEVVTTLLLNPVSLLLMQGLLNGPWRHPESGFPDSDTFGPGYRMPLIVGTDRVHAGFLLAVLAIAVFGVVMAWSPLGLRVRAAGEAPDAARFSGIAVERIRWRGALLSGAIAGVAGAVQVMGVQHQLTASIAVGYGYTGVVVATLGALHAAGVSVVGLVLGLIAVGAQSASRVLQLPFQMGQLVTAVLLLTTVSAVTIARRRTRASTSGVQRAKRASRSPRGQGRRSASGVARWRGLRGRGTQR
ncbi:ABC transporter permease [Desertimonas flava]|uniref:ABC transporter permease n=1 Tax=Desertimonas flava TaxID=2064846 RepID=UPI001969184B|nr:ABC transporter permease [Desertimonas flava]